jgi:transposase
MRTRFGAALEPPVRPVVDAVCDQMKELRSARDALIKDCVAANNRAQNLAIPLLKRQNAQRMKQIDTQIEAIDEALVRLVKEDAKLQSRFHSLVSIPRTSNGFLLPLRAKSAGVMCSPGIGATTALALLIEMPELGHLENGAAASLAGLAPITRESGQWKGKSRITGGRASIRRALFMPALAAIRFNPDLIPTARGFDSRGIPLVPET